MLKKRKTNPTTNKKSIRNRLFFALPKKEEKGFLSKNNKKIEVLELEEKKKKHYKKVNHKKIEYLELDNQPVKKKIIHKEQIEILDFEENTKYEEKSLPMKNFIKKNFDVSMIVMSTAAVILLVFSFFVKQDSFNVRVKRFLDGLGIYTSEVKNIEIASNNYSNEGSWKVKENVKWLSDQRVELTYDVNSILKESSNRYRDVIFVIDSTSSLSGEKNVQIINSTKEVEHTILSDSNNQIGIILFGSSAFTYDYFFNDPEEIQYLWEGTYFSFIRDYYAALDELDYFLNDYTKSENTDLIVVFITGGKPIRNVASGNAMYEMLKEKYPDMVIRAIQYEMGNEIVEEISNISDEQWAADKETLKNALLEATMMPVKYDEFSLTSTIDSHYTIESVNDIKADQGTVYLEEESGNQVVSWNLGNAFATGTEHQIKITLSLKEQYMGNEGFYPTNQNVTIQSKLPNESKKTVSSTETTVLGNKYAVYYKNSAPEGCSIESISSERHFIFDTVSINDNELSCDGYLFKGWQVEDEYFDDVQMINDHVFVMPDHDVYLQATWTKQDIIKNVSGTVYEKATLYRVLEKEVETNSGYAREYTGVHQDSMDPSLSTEKIYHWYSSGNYDANTIKGKNNVIFAGLCWQIIRTTDTGGVRLIYNGFPVDQQCLSSRGTQAGYNSSSTTRTLSPNYYYGTDYEYDIETKQFHLAGTITTGEVKRGQYTCYETTADGTCTTLYYVTFRTSSGYTVVYKISSSSPYAMYGNMPFSLSRSSPDYVGYMYGDLNYFGASKSLTPNNRLFTDKNISSSTTYYYGEDITYDNGVYTLENPTSARWSSTYSSASGKYTCMSNTETSCEMVYYIAYASSSYMYVLSMTEGHLIDDYNVDLVFGEEYEEGPNNTFSLINTETIKLLDWPSRRADFVGQYTCGDDSTTCTTMRYLKSVSVYSYVYLPTDIIWYSNSFTYENGVYTLSDDKISFWDIRDSDNRNSLKTRHYSCLEKDTTSCETIYYLYEYNTQNTNGYVWFYIPLQNGKSIEEALNDMLYNDNVNQKDSVAKEVVELWYKNYLLNYSEYIDDTIYCNDRSLSNFETNKFNPNGGDSILALRAFGSGDLSCPKVTDRFSVSNEKARLKYPVALISTEELDLLYNPSIYKIGDYYWTISPSDYMRSDSYGTVVDSSSTGRYQGSQTSLERGIRPVISLKSGLSYYTGTGSASDPYIVDIDD